ncbi:hypothetical protein AA313_de0202766 [Arthrobotrys entomopaga]|nr:hypothetical protein AA313_de0202766 [Arthrobotrys entomopaga]
MNRIWRFSRVAPRHPTLSLFKPHHHHLLTRQQRPLPLRIRCLATVADQKTVSSVTVVEESSPSSSSVQSTLSHDSTFSNDISGEVSSEVSNEVSKSASTLQTLLAAEQSDHLDTSLPSDSLAPPATLRPLPQARFNDIQVQHISDQLHKQIFGEDPPKPPEELVELAKEHLQLHDLLGKQSAPTPPIGFELPKLLGNSLDEHFFRLGKFTGEPWLGLARQFADSELAEKPTIWEVDTPGWTKYGRDGKVSEKGCAPPQDPMLVFDVEVLYKISPYAVIACAASPEGWYSWISPQVLDESPHDKHLISFGDPKNPDLKRIIVGHNVSYDRARIQEEYNLKQTGTFFLDTMSLHAAVNGMCSRQRPTWMKHRKHQELKEKLKDGIDPELSNMMEKAAEELEPELWVEHSSINSLRDVAHFHCKVSISKETRDMMGEMTSVKDLRPKLQECFRYCATDVDVTHRVYKVVLPLFLETCPHPVSFSALRHMGSLLLPVNSSWKEYVETSEKTYTDLLDKVKNHLESLTHQAVSISFGASKEEMFAAEQKMVEQAQLLADENQTYKSLLAEEKKLLRREKELTKPKRSRTKIPTAEVVEAEDKPEKRGRPKKVVQEVTVGSTLSPEASEELKEIVAAKKRLESEKSTTFARIAEMEAELARMRTKQENDKAQAEKRVATINKDPWSSENAWISQLDWTGREIRYKKQKKPTDPLVPVARQKMPGYPAWYKDLYPKTDGPMNISVRTRAAPIMLRLQWDGYPLVWTDKYGWTFRVPLKDVHKYENTPMVVCEDLIGESNLNVANDQDAIYYKLPHNGNGSTRCVNPLAKGYQRYFEDGILTSEFAQAKEALDMNAACSYWISARERIKSQFVVWENSKDENIERNMGFSKPQDDLGLILPQIVTMGTITRRAVENTWLTASNAKKNRVGSELKAMIKAPPGYSFVGADVE